MGFIRKLMSGSTASSTTTELLAKLREKTGKTEAELKTLAKQKMSPFDGLLSEEAALFLLAREASIFIEGAPSQPNRGEYHEYLQSPGWDEKRKQVLQRANFSCERCGEMDMPLEVHHKHYRTLGVESEEDLMAVCRKCHLELELKKEKQKRKLKEPE